MDATKLQAKINGGYAKAAQRLGLSCGQYRPTSALTAAIAPGNRLRAILASFNAEDMKYSKPNKYGKATWYCLADGSLLKVGDYLVQPDGSAYFIAGMQLHLPIFVVGCNRTVDILRPQQASGVGAVGYGGNIAATETPLVTQFAASILQGTKGEKSPVDLPGDVRIPWWAVLLPVLPGGVSLRTGDIINDDMARRYIISSAELTDLGWRITAMQAET
jgi:hypothetical protein